MEDFPNYKILEGEKNLTSEKATFLRLEAFARLSNGGCTLPFDIEVGRVIEDIGFYGLSENMPEEKAVLASHFAYAQALYGDQYVKNLGDKDGRPNVEGSDSSIEIPNVDDFSFTPNFQSWVDVLHKQFRVLPEMLEPQDIRRQIESYAQMVLDKQSEFFTPYYTNGQRVLVDKAVRFIAQGILDNSIKINAYPKQIKTINSRFGVVKASLLPTQIPALLDADNCIGSRSDLNNTSFFNGERVVIASVLKNFPRAKMDWYFVYSNKRAGWLPASAFVSGPKGAQNNLPSRLPAHFISDMYRDWTYSPEFDCTATIHHALTRSFGHFPMPRYSGDLAESLVKTADRNPIVMNDAKGLSRFAEEEGIFLVQLLSGDSSLHFFVVTNIRGSVNVVSNAYMMRNSDGSIRYPFGVDVANIEALRAQVLSGRSLKAFKIAERKSIQN